MRTILNALLIAAGLALLLSLCGCNTTKFTKSPDGAVTIENRRMFWTTDSYECQWSTNGAMLNVNKSGVDTAALQALGQLAIQAAGATTKGVVIP